MAKHFAGNLRADQSEYCCLSVKSMRLLVFRDYPFSTDATFSEKQTFLTPGIVIPVFKFALLPYYRRIVSCNLFPILHSHPTWIYLKFYFFIFLVLIIPIWTLLNICHCLFIFIRYMAATWSISWR